MNHRAMSCCAGVLLTAAAFSPLRASQNQNPAATSVRKADARAWPAANPKDVESVDAIVHAVYDVISGPAGDRDWNRMRSLFTPDARLIPIRKQQDGSFEHKPLTVEEYVQSASSYFEKDGFYESEVARRTEQFGQMAVVFTTYESRHAKGEKPFARGINSMTFYNDGKRWWCLSIIWDAERPDNQIPDKYLH